MMIPNRCKECKHFVPWRREYMVQEWQREEYDRLGNCQHIHDAGAVRTYLDSEPITVDGDWGCVLWEARDEREDS